MAVSDFLIPGLGAKQTVKIMTVDPANRRIEAATNDGAMIQIAVWNVDAVFRWPKEEEIWTVRQDNGIWVLDSVVEQPQSQTLPIENLEAGDVRISAPNNRVYINDQPISILALHVANFNGVDPTGATDSTKGLQAALNYLSPGQKLDTSGGTYLFSSLTCTTNNITLCGNGTLLSNYKNDNVTNAVWLSGDNVMVDGLTFRNLHPQTPFVHATLGIVENGVLLIVGRTAFGVPPAQVATIQNCTFHGSYSSQFEVRNARNVIVKNNRLFDNSGNGMSITNCTDSVLIDGNQVYNTGDDMIVVVTDSSVPGSTKRVTITNNIVDTGDAKGIATTGADKLIIEGNHIRNTFTFGIAVLQDGFYSLGASHRAIVTGNTLERCGYKYGDSATNLHPTVATVPIAIYVSPGSQAVSITKNIIIDTQGAAIVADTQHLSTTTTGTHVFPLNTVTVADTSNLAPFGFATVISTNGTASTFSYTGKSTNTLTGVIGGFGTFSSGSTVIQATVSLTIEDNQIIGAGGVAIQVGNPDGTDWIRALDVSICNNHTRNTQGGIVAGSITGLTILGNHVRSYKQGFVGARRGILIGSVRNAVYDNNIVFNDDGGDEPILVYGVNKHVVDGGSNITLAPSDP